MQRKRQEPSLHTEWSTFTDGPTGHYVSDCPTNEDPAYDIAAGYDYICKFCGERGTHYFMFCPLNPDPNSIYRRRRDKAFQNLHGSPSRSEVGLSKTFASAPQSLKSRNPLIISRLQIGVSKVCSSTADLDLFVNRKRLTSPDGATGGLGDDSGFNKEGLGMTDFATCGERGQNGAAGDNKLDIGLFEAMGSSEADMVWERLNNREHSRGSEEQKDTLLVKLINENTADSTTAPKINQSPHMEFLCRLFMKHPSQRNPSWRPRMTALGMWDINDAEKCQEEYEEEMVKMREHELSTGLKSPDYNERSLTYYSDIIRENTWCVDGDGYSKVSDQDIDSLIESKGFQEPENRLEEQKDSPSRDEKVRAIRKKINSIECLRSKLASGDEMDRPETGQMAIGKLSQEKVDEISRRMQAPEPSSPSGLTSASSELSSPPRLLCRGSGRGRYGFHIN
jgi:hypothetical protein